MRYMLLALIFMVGATASADDRDDIKAFVRAQSVSPIKDFVRYQRERKRSYAEAVEHHTKTKEMVIVWIGFTDSDELFKMWSQTKDLGYHVFVKDFDGVYTGVVIGRDFSGVFGRLGTITNNYVENIKKEVTSKYTPTQPDCPDGKCPLVPQQSFSVPQCTTSR